MATAGRRVQPAGKHDASAGEAQGAILPADATSTERLAGPVAILRPRSKLPAFAALRPPFSGGTATRNIRCSSRDVQFLAGHRSFETTERYVEGDTWAQRRLVGYV
jgi:hypothetical protein